MGKISENPFSKLRITRAYIKLLCIPEGEAGIVSLMQIGNCEIRMLEASKAGALQTKFKELVAVAIAVHQGCSDCILFHVSNAKSHGATRAELVETLAVCIEMGGGPSSVYAGHSLAGYDEIQ